LCQGLPGIECVHGHDREIALCDLPHTESCVGPERPNGRGVQSSFFPNAIEWREKYG
jgi:hypothetical protein